MNRQTAQDIAKANGFSPQADGRILLLKSAPTQLIEHTEVKLVPN